MKSDQFLPHGTVSGHDTQAKRPDTARAFPGVHVFPGGIIDAGDSFSSWKEHVAVKIQAKWSEYDEEEFKRRMASIREVFEETNVLLSTPAASFSHKLLTEDEKKDDRWFSKYCSAHKAVPDVGALIPFARWITPVPLRARFDTVFYLAPVQEAHLEHIECNPGEIDRLDWCSPAEALDQAKAGVIQLAPPTFVKLSEMLLCQEYDTLLDPPSKALPAPVLPVLLTPTEDAPLTIAFPGDHAHPTSSSSPSDHLRRMESPGHDQQYKQHPSTMPLLSNIRRTAASKL